MKKKKAKSLLVTIITLVIGVLYQAYIAPKKTDKAQSSHSKKLVLTKHARCRMKCRYIDISEIKMVLDQGKINQRKSKLEKKPCPVVAREAYSQVDKQNIRVISADCADKQTIITVIDLSNEYNCYCE